METKYTPGPWRMDNRNESLLGSNGNRVTVWNAGLSFGNRTDETEANACLIAAAPELLTVAKQAREVLAFPYINEARRQAVLIALLDVIIAKAEGRQ